LASSEVNPSANSAKSRSCPARSVSSRKRLGQRTFNSPCCFPLPLR
jgi:hypothetical protein